MHRAEFTDELRRRRAELTAGLLRIYGYYRVFVGLTLLLLVAQRFFSTRLGSLEPEYFLWGTWIYTGINLISVVLVQAIPRRVLERELPNFLLVALDILALVFLMYCSGGVASGMAGLILVAVAFGAIIVTGRRSTLLAAVAAIAVLYEEFYLSLSGGSHDYFQAGVMGILYFVSSLTIQGFSKRLRDNDMRALTQAAELSDLERINRQIVQRMRTGIILVGAENEVRMTNQSALGLLALSDQEELQELPPAIIERLQQWRADTSFRPPPFQSRFDTPEIRINFFPVRTDDADGDVTIFIEDTGEIQQQAQQLKLVSLARLSGSIAHEIRNPLSAVDHAAQLLRESTNLDKGDRRLTEIIHSHAQRMNGVVQNVLEMSRRKPPLPTRLELGALLEDFVTTFKESGNPDAIIEVDVSPPEAQVRIDESQMLQVLTNLVGNGIRYSEQESGRPYVALVGGIDERTERPYLNIIDEGPGVPEDQVDNLFEPFFTTENKGTGLGLYISRELCEANQARLSYERSASGGSCFRLNFAHPDRISH
ncbi:MAG: two-component system sensor histidine kinase NtrB [Pseudomonadales bacterium]